MRYGLSAQTQTKQQHLIKKQVHTIKHVELTIHHAKLMIQYAKLMIQHVNGCTYLGFRSSKEPGGGEAHTVRRT